MELAEVLRRRHMVRSFSGDPVAEGVVDQIVRAARRTPSAGNTDGLDLVVLRSREGIARFWEATTTQSWRERSRRWPGLSRAPVVVCVFVRPEEYAERYGEPDKAGSGLGPGPSGGGVDSWPVPYWFVDAGFCIQAMLLAAVDAGVGACFLGNFRGESELKAALGVPEDRRYVGAVLTGEASGDDPPSPSLDRHKRHLTEVVHEEHW